MAAGTTETWETFAWEGREIAWQRAGAGPPVVLCHGTPFSSVVWRDVAAALAESNTVHTWDMPGYGRSSMDPAHPVDLGVQGRALAALLAHWELDRPAVVAHDIGGATALRAHLLHGRDYASLTLADAVALRPWGSEFFRLVRDHADVFAALPAPIHRGLVTAYLDGATHRPLTDDQRNELAAPWLDERGQAAFYAQMAQADERWTVELEGLLSSVRCPATVVWGADDGWLPVEHAHRLAALLGAGAPYVLDGAGHLVQYDAPEPLIGVLRRAVGID